VSDHGGSLAWWTENWTTSFLWEKESDLQDFVEDPRKRENSLVVSWLGTGVARVLRVNASEPMVGWKGKHPQSGLVKVTYN
jgi:hypothetical protein